MSIPIEQRDIPTIKKWRKERHDAGLPCGFEDFYTFHGICKSCRGGGSRITQFYGYHHCDTATCESCSGTGKAE